MSDAFFHARSRRFLTLGGIVLAGCAAVAFAQQSSPGLTRNNLVRSALLEHPGNDMVGFEGYFEPGSSSGPHRHPGAEMFYVVSGHGVMLREGHEPIALEPGMTVFSEPGEKGGSFTHEVRNLSSTEPLRTYVVLLLEEGEPPSLPVD